MDVHYNTISYPYNTAGSFIEYFEGLTYEHVNFIFSGASHAQVPAKIVIYILFKIFFLSLSLMEYVLIFLFY